MGKTKIEWTDYTFNPWQGCAKVSKGCEHCYAEDWADRFGLDVWGVNKPRQVSADSTWRKPRMWNKQAFSQFGRKGRVFCASLADVFEDHPDVEGARERLWNLIYQTPNLIWQILTKRPENVNRMIPPGWKDGRWPDNVWLGTSVENQEVAGQRCYELLGTGARVLFLSCEPLIGRLNLEGLQHNGFSFSALSEDFFRDRFVDWIIVGGESGTKARPMVDVWPRSLRTQAYRNGVPFFFKQWGKYLPHTQASPADIPAIDSTVKEHEMLYDIHIVDGKQHLFRDLGKYKAGNWLDGEQYQQFPDLPFTKIDHYEQERLV